MKIYDGDLNMEEQAGAYFQKLAAAAASYDADNLFGMLADAEQKHHDALVEMNVPIGPEKPQLMKGAACLLKTSPGKA